MCIFSICYVLSWQHCFKWKNQSQELDHQLRSTCCESDIIDYCVFCRTLLMLSVTLYFPPSPAYVVWFDSKGSAADAHIVAYCCILFICLSFPTILPSQVPRFKTIYTSLHLHVIKTIKTRG